MQIVFQTRHITTVVIIATCRNEAYSSNLQIRAFFIALSAIAFIELH